MSGVVAVTASSRFLMLAQGESGLCRAASPPDFPTLLLPCFPARDCQAADWKRRHKAQCKRRPPNAVCRSQVRQRSRATGRPAVHDAIRPHSGFWRGDATPGSPGGGGRDGTQTLRAQPHTPPVALVHATMLQLAFTLASEAFINDQLLGPAILERVRQRLPGLLEQQGGV